jgi:hypothetical protein
MNQNTYCATAKLLVALTAVGSIAPNVYADPPLKVQVTNTVPVTVSNAVTIANPVSTVTVGNGTANPVAVLDAKVPLQLPFNSLLGTPHLSQTINTFPMTATVPAGQMWVIEHVSLNFAATATPGDGASVYLDTPQVRDSVPVVQHALGSLYYYDASVQTKVYVMPGETLALSVIVCCSSQPDNLGIQAVVTGYSVPHP